jgi:dynein heavy chain
VDTKTGRLDLWERLIQPFNYNPKIPFFEVTVPTTEILRMGYIMQRLLAVNQPVLFTGLAGKRAILL